MLKREDLRAIALTACAVGLILGIWTLVDGLQLPQAESGTPDFGPKLEIIGAAVIALALGGIAITLMAFRALERRGAE